jgi:hypothetical protein
MVPWCGIKNYVSMKTCGIYHYLSKKMTSLKSAGNNGGKR